MARKKLARPERYYWDSVTFLAWLKPEEDRVPLCRGVLTAAEEGTCVIVTSALALTEVLNIRNHPRLGRESEDLIRRFFLNEYIHVVGLDRFLAEEARELVWSHGIHPKDSIHVATAIALEVDALHTFDKKLIKTSGVEGLTICEPTAQPRRFSNLGPEQSIEG